MAVPKQRTSTTRRNKRRSHDALRQTALLTCPQCGEPKLSHRVCKHCGNYRGKERLQIST